MSIDLERGPTQAVTTDGADLGVGCIDTDEDDNRSLTRRTVEWVLGSKHVEKLWGALFKIREFVWVAERAPRFSQLSGSRSFLDPLPRRNFEALVPRWKKGSTCYCLRVPCRSLVTSPAANLLIGYVKRSRRDLQPHWPSSSRSPAEGRGILLKRQQWKPGGQQNPSCGSFVQCTHAQM